MSEMAMACLSGTAAVPAPVGCSSSHVGVRSGPRVSAAASQSGRMGAGGAVPRWTARAGAHTLSAAAAGRNEGWGGADRRSLALLTRATAAEAEASPEAEAEADPGPELLSDRNVDYTLLRDLLAGQKFQEADDETRRLLIEVAGEDAEARGYVYFSEVRTIPVADLQTMDNLWRHFSKEKFGYSVQARLWRGSKRNWDAFFLKIGWTTGTNLYKKWGAIDGASEYTYTLKEAEKGHLPLTNALRGTSLLEEIFIHPAFEVAKK